jgi:hypothetical protein
MAVGSMLAWCSVLRKALPHAPIRNAHISLPSSAPLADFIQKESDTIQEKILDLVAEQKERLSMFSSPLSSLKR